MFGRSLQFLELFRNHIALLCTLHWYDLGHSQSVCLTDSTRFNMFTVVPRSFLWNPL